MLTTERFHLFLFCDLSAHGGEFYFDLAKLLALLAATLQLQGRRVYSINPPRYLRT